VTGVRHLTQGVQQQYEPSLVLTPQIQLRDLPGFAEARHQLLQLRPGNRANWINFAVAHHLHGNHELAVQVQQKIPVLLKHDIARARFRLRSSSVIAAAQILGRKCQDNSTHACTDRAAGCNLHDTKCCQSEGVGSVVALRH